MLTAGGLAPCLSSAVGGLIGFGLSFVRPVSEWTHKQHVRRPYATIGVACAVGFAIGLVGYGEVLATLMAAIVVLWLNAPDAFSRPEGAEAA